MSRLLVGARALTYATGGVLTIAAATRLRSIVHGDSRWPPPPRDLASAMQRLLPTERLDWTLRVVAHGLTSGRIITSGDVALPADWPVPNDVEMAIESRGDTTRIHVTSRTGASACTATLVHGTLIPGGPQPESLFGCRPRASLSTARFHAISRAPLAPLPNTARQAGRAQSASTWRQYRGDSAKGASVARTAAKGRPVSWRTDIGGEIRTSPSLIGDHIVVGTHGTGTLLSLGLDGALQWRVTLPNWIHEDAVSDGHVVAVGFGDNGRSFFSRAPAGVAAYRVADGVLLWTAFESNSVMSSPVLDSGRVIYATAGGVLRSRDVHTGRILKDVRMSGAVQMAPPALSGGHVIVAMDPNRVCSIATSNLATTWCQNLPGVVSASGSAPTVVDGVVLQSALSPISLYRIPAQAAGMGMSFYAQSLTDIVRGRSYRPAGQRLFALDVADGRQLWSSPNFSAKRVIRGHSSGTAVAADGLGAVVLPIPDIVIAFDVRTGHELWRAPGDQSRGPMLVLDSAVYLFGAGGSIRVLRLRDGTPICAFRANARFDRAGPTAAGDLLLIGSIPGVMYGVPRHLLDDCRVNDLQALLQDPARPSSEFVH